MNLRLFKTIAFKKAIFLFILISFYNLINANNITTSFSYTGAEQTFVVPGGISSIIVDAVGAAGGHAATDQNGRGG